MTIRKLEIYYVVAEKLNMTQAAKELYISQPSISQVIKELEEGMGVRLFQRLGRRIYLTDEGVVFQKYCLRMLNLYKESQKVMEDMKELRTGNIRIGASSTIGTYLLPDIIADFKREYPGVNIELVIENTHMVSEEILKNSVDFGFIEGEVDNDELETREFWRDELVVISSPKHRWKKTICLKDLEEATLIQREEGSGSRKTYEGVMGIRKENTFVFGSVEAIKRAVKKDLGVACISKLAIEDEQERGELVVSRVKGVSIKRELKLLSHRDKEFSLLIHKFIEFSREYKKGVNIDIS